MEFLLTVCMAAIACALVRMLVPDKKYTKPMALLIACIFVLTSVSAVSGIKFDIGVSTQGVGSSTQYAAFSGEVIRSFQEKICREMSDKIKALLAKEGISPEEIHVIVNISGLYSISISQVKLVFGEGQQDEAQTAGQLLSNELPQDIKLTVKAKE